MPEHVTSVRVYYEDTDSGGIVYYANYLKYMERARTEFLRDRGFEQQELLEKQRRMFVVGSVRLDYHKPAKLDDLLQVRSRIEKTGRASLIFSQRILNQNGQALCSGKVKIACLDADSFRPVGLPTALQMGIS